MVIITSIQIWITYNKIQLSANDVTMSKCHKPNPLEAVSFSLYSSAAPFLLHSSPTTPPLGSPCFLSLQSNAAFLQLCLWIHTTCLLLHLAALWHQMSGPVCSVVSCVISSLLFIVEQSSFIQTWACLSILSSVDCLLKCFQLVAVIIELFMSTWTQVFT